MKILHVSHNFYPVTGGVEKNIEDLCIGLKQLGHQSDVCCVRIPGTAKEEVYRGIRIQRIRALNMRFYKIAPTVARIVSKYDVVHVHGLGFFSDYLGITKLMHKRRLVLSTHGGIFHTKKISIIKKPYFYIMSRLILRYFDKVIAVSNSDKETFSRICSDIDMIPNGIDAEQLSKVKRSPEKDVFLFVGRISQNKRIDNLIRTISEIKKAGRKPTLVVVGQDWEGLENGLKKLANKTGLGKDIVFTGRINNENLIHYFERAQFFVSASEYEGFGISVLEAMAAGLPVIVNDIEAFDTFVKNEENGFVIDYSNPKKAANQIIDIINRKDLRKTSENARNSAKNYDYKKIVRKFEKVYKSIYNKS